MNTLYIHIPFCKQACNYCDFHFSTSLKNKTDLLQALKKEMHFYANYFDVKNIDSVYFGGGTPSLLTADELNGLIDTANKIWSIDVNAEITLEANPDDLTKEKIIALKQTPINRLSIGIQSFYDADLQYMNRAHTSEQATASVKYAQEKGFNNISIDLIYGIPQGNNEQWLNNIQQAFDLNVQHLSCYALTVEPKTQLAHAIKKGIVKNVNDEQAAQQFEILVNAAKQYHFIQYEISNFGKENYFSKHNSNYWLKGNYLGIGPSAHSYNGTTRHWNVRNNSLYIKGIESNTPNIESEIITTTQHYNEYIMTALRTIWGVDLNYVKTLGKDFYINCLAEAEPYLKSSALEITNNKLILTNSGKLLADKIASDLFVVD